jgi:hypothetical protein
MAGREAVVTYFKVLAQYHLEGVRKMKENTVSVGDILTKKRTWYFPKICRFKFVKGVGMDRIHNPSFPCTLLKAD